MPMPTPRDGEKEQAFISRCMEALNSEFPENERRAGVCYTQWRRKPGEKAAADLEAIERALAQPLTLERVLARQN